MTDIAAPTLVHLDPKTLTPHPFNVRSELGDIKALTASIKAVGVLEPLLVCPDGDGGHWIIAGHRRKAGAIAAGLDLVPAIVRPDLSDDDAMQTAMMLVENLRRADLTTAEEIKGYQQLAAFGQSATAIAKQTGTKTAQVKQSLTIAASYIATEATERHDLTLDQALVLAEFEDDPEAIKTLTVVAVTEPQSWDHVVARHRADRADRELYDAKVAELTNAGFAVIEAPTWGEKTTITLLDKLDIDDTAHMSCPGHVLSIYDYDEGDQMTTDAWCLDPDTYGHERRTAHEVGSIGPATTAGGSGSGWTEEQKAERRLVIANNKAWRAATEVRLAYLRLVLGQRTPPKGTLRFVTNEILTDPGTIGRGDDRTLADLLGTPTDVNSYRRTVGAAALKKGITDARLPLMLLAQVAARFEAGMGDHTWRRKDPEVARYLSFLAATGYTLSEIEQMVITMADGEHQHTPNDQAGPDKEPVKHDGPPDAA